MLANTITISRIPLSILLLSESSYSSLFWMIYILCGITDILDGFLARRLHTESKTGELLDSIADLFFTVAYAVKILPLLSLPGWIWIWTAVIASVKISAIFRGRKKERKFCIAHSGANKLTGFLIFILPLTIHFVDIKYGAVIVCATATYAAVQDIFF